MTAEADANSTEVTFDLTKGDETRLHLYAQPQWIRLLLSSVPWVLIAMPVVLLVAMVHLFYFGIGKKAYTQTTAADFPSVRSPTSGAFCGTSSWKPRSYLVTDVKAGATQSLWTIRIALLHWDREASIMQPIKDQSACPGLR